MKRTVGHPRLLLSTGAKMIWRADVHGERFGRGIRARKRPHFCGEGHPASGAEAATYRHPRRRISLKPPSSKSRTVVLGIVAVKHFPDITGQPAGNVSG